MADHVSVQSQYSATKLTFLSLFINLLTSPYLSGIKVAQDCPIALNDAVGRFGLKSLSFGQGGNLKSNSCRRRATEMM